MADDELDEDLGDEEEAAGPEDLDEEDLEDLDEGDEVEEGDEGDEDLAVVEEEPDAVVVEPAPVVPKPREDEEDDDEEEDEDSDDVEASLDVILKERLVVPDDETDDEEDTPDTEDRGEATPKVLPKQPGEFVCQSCFLVKHPSQLADRERMLCRDCV